MNQDKHLFQFTGQQIADACTAEVEYRQRRIAYWEDVQKYQIARQSTFKASIEIVLREWQHSSGKGVRFEPVIHYEGEDIADANRMLDMAGSKITEHKRMMDEYQLKGGAYGSQGTRTYELDPADVAYFKLNGARRTES